MTSKFDQEKDFAGTYKLVSELTQSSERSHHQIASAAWDLLRIFGSRQVDRDPSGRWVQDLDKDAHKALGCLIVAKTDDIRSCREGASEVDLPSVEKKLRMAAEALRRAINRLELRHNKFHVHNSTPPVIKEVNDIPLEEDDMPALEGEEEDDMPALKGEEEDDMPALEGEEEDDMPALEGEEEEDDMPALEGEEEDDMPSLEGDDIPSL